jgi:hypothetical protein
MVEFHFDLEKIGLSVILSQLEKKNYTVFAKKRIKNVVGNRLIKQKCIRCNKL